MNGERSRLEAAALMEMAQAIVSRRPLVTVLRSQLDHVVELTGASRGAMISIDPGGLMCDVILSGPVDRLPPHPTADVVRKLLHETTSTRLQGVALPSGSLGFPAGDPSVTSLVGSQIRVLDRCHGCTYLTDTRGGHRFTDEDERLVAAMAALAGMALANRHLAADLEHDAEWRGALARVAAAALAGGSVRQFLGRVAAAARELADADLALVIGPGDGHRLPTVLAADGEAGARLVGLPAGSALRLRDIGPAIAAQTPAGLTSSQMLRVMRKVRRPAFDLAVRERVEGFWEHAAGMIDLVALRWMAYGPTGPPNGLERGLHDDVAQTLFGVGMQIEAVAVRLGDADLSARLQEVASSLDWLIDRLRHHDEKTLTPFS